jgi:hypothetical protein
MTVIGINAGYRIELDTHSWQISKLTRHKKYPDGYWQGVAWFPRLSQCCEWLIEQGLRESEVEGAAEVVRVLSELVADLMAAVERGLYCDSWLAEKENAAGSTSADGVNRTCNNDHRVGNRHGQL